MVTIVWLIIIIVFIRWALSKSGQGSSELIDVNSKNYLRGYRDGYKAGQLEASKSHKMPEHVTVSQTSQLAHAASQNVAKQHDNVVRYHSPSDLPAYNFQPVKSAEQQAEDKKKRDLQNINTTLYVASFLLVAAAALFIAVADISVSVRFMGVWLVTIAFYGAGLILHRHVERLRPAAVAFAGTGLALLPFTGIAMYNFVLPDAAICWFITSLISLAAFVYAASQLENEVLSYLSIAFGISLSLSGVAVLHTGLIWYYVVLILFGSLMTILAQVKPKWLPSYFALPIQKTNNWIVPLTVVASVVAANDLTVTDFWVISLVSAFYYGAVAASSPDVRDVSIFTTRFLASLTILLMAYDVSDSSWVTVGIAMSLVGLIQVLISSVYLPHRKAGSDNNEVWLWLGMIMQLVAPLFVQNDASWDVITTSQLLLVLLSSATLAYCLRRIKLSVFGTVALAILPIVWGRQVIEPGLENHWISLIFIIFASLVLAVRYIKQLNNQYPSVRPYLIGNFVLFIVEALLLTVDVSSDWGFGLWSAATILVYGLMYIERQPWLSILANGMIWFSIVRFVQPQIASHWVALIFIVLASISLGLLSFEKYIKSTHGLVVRPYIVANIALFVIESLMFTTGVESSWGFMIWSIATIIIYGLMYLERQAWLSILANIMIWISVMRYIQPSIELYWVGFIFIVLAAISLVLLSIEKQIEASKPPFTRQSMVINYALFTIQSLILTYAMDQNWGFGLWVVATVFTYVLIILERQPWLILVANFMLLVSALRLMDIQNVAEQWKALILSWIAFAIFYGVYWLLKLVSQNQYAVYFWWSAIIVAGVINLSSLFGVNHDVVIAAGLGLAVVSSAIAYEGFANNKYEYIDIGVALATIGLQRVLGVTSPDTNVLVYTHWWAFAVALLSGVYYLDGRHVEAKARMNIALTFISLFGGLAALGFYGVSDVPYKTIFLIEHALILFSGAVLSRKQFTIWGAVGVILSVLWMVKDFFYLMLALIALVLIGAAIYALIKQSKNTK